MKTQIITIFAALVLGIGVTNTANAATAKNADDNYTILTDVSAINKIEVRGNVELYISDGAADQVKVYNKYYSETALVQSKSGVLRIASYKADKLIVWVTANDLRSISAFDNVEVKSFGNISKIEFDVDLHDNAFAKLNLDSFSTDVTVNDNAKVCLSGSVTEYTLKCDREQNVDHKDLSTVHSTKIGSQSMAGSQTLDLADVQ
ncbi:DUF2807 domain-containing protein [Mucilaginibacter sp. L3T2-6]|uniref:GIN domain-containing protein n=1 Tax=Mucilaginibacter sp. L3T2-6 TaxID=3062491 RepID=UPI002675C3FA|nr:DUF2807 domain-containing protein [Mucilaginibacter sp. L3T2-6]MDO3643431.1 DUF2807 domain-containing protein [Mucilaginibacter sp. L3T2-6]MDV6215636.1 DUF2807 domain-containing protein [Mucilaginibacter sp. L3T2-6]